MNLEAVKKRALTTSTPSSWDGRRRASRRFLRRTGGPLPAVTLGPRAEGPEQATERLPWMLGSSPLLSGLDFSTMRASQRGRSCSQKESRWGRPRRKSQRSLLFRRAKGPRSEEHTSELQSLMRISYAVFCLKKKNKYYL